MLTAKQKEAQRGRKRYHTAMRTNPEAVRAKARKKYRKKAYGISDELWELLLLHSCGRCASCGDQFENTPYACHIDHDHTTGQVRELLCHSCNVALGMLRDDPRRISQLLKYIERHKSSCNGKKDSVP